MKNVCLVTVLGLFLAGCANVVEISQPPVSLDLRSEVAKARVVRHEDQYVRTFVREDKSVKEVLGAKCSVASAELKGSFVTPVLVHVPVFKGKPTALRVVCDAGTLAGEKLLQPQLSGTAVGGPSAAGLVAAVVTSMIVAGKDRWAVPLGAGVSAQSNLLGFGIELKPKSQ